MNITITPGAATEDATQIDKIIEKMEESMQILDNEIKRNIPSAVQTSWSDTLLNNWQTYYGADVPAAMADMKLSAANLRLAVEQALKYSQEG